MKLPDPPVPHSMDFGKRQIEGFAMKQDLAFCDPNTRRASEKATNAFHFTAYHPPYAYGAHPRG